MSMKRFIDLFEELARHYDRSIVFADLLDYCINQFIINPDVEVKYRNKYTTKDYETFYSLMGEWILTLQEKLEEKSWFDFWGLVYEEVVQSHGKSQSMGQFYTPDAVVNLIVKVTDPPSQGSWVNDPACGSGRFLVALNSKAPGLFMLGQDLDEMSCKMTILNFLVHGVQGAVAWMNTLEDDFYGAWKVNEFLNTMGVPTVMRVDSLVEATCFITDKHGYSEESSVPVGQTTLI